MVSRLFTSPTWAFPLGTDTLGRDMLAGIIHGVRVSYRFGLETRLFSF
jgi:peptide/nickel transport system permease protein